MNGLKAHEYLALRMAMTSRVTGRELARALYGEKPHSAGPAKQILNRLDSRGLLSYRIDKNGRGERTGYEITPRGEEALAEVDIDRHRGASRNKGTR